MAKKKVKRARLAVQMSLLFAVSMALLLAILTGSILFVVEQALVTSQTTATYDIAKARAEELGKWISTFTNELRIYASQGPVLNGDENSIRPYILSLDTVENPAVLNVVFANLRGKAFNSKGALTDVADRDYFDAIIHQGKSLFVGNAVIARSTGTSIVILAVPAKNKNGQVYGLIGLSLSIKDVNDTVLKIHFGISGSAFAVDGKGVVIANRDPAVIMRDNILAKPPQELKNFEPLMQFIKDSKQGHTVVESPEGELLMVTTPIVNTPNWALILVSPMSEILGIFLTLVPIMVGLSLLILLILIALSIVISRSVVRSIVAAGNSIQEIAAGDADLTVQIPPTRRDEIGQLTVSFNFFVTKLRGIVVNIQQSQSELTEIGGKLTASVQEMAGSIHEILANIESVGKQVQFQSGSVSETSSAVTQIARNIESLEQMIETQASGVTQASASVEEMVGNVATVTKTIETMTHEFQDLLESTNAGVEKQTQVNERIRGIADQSEILMEANVAIAQMASQTNLLAMNAAIEAAHAGDTGKGFAVVAEEIRRLSETATSQSQTIGDQLKKIRSSIDSVVTASGDSQETFALMARRISDVDRLVVEISQAMGEQQEGSKQIFETLRTMNDITAQVRTGSQEMSVGNRAILDSVRTLQDTTSAIKASMEEIAIGAKEINATASTLTTLSDQTAGTIQRVESVIGQFKV